MATSLRQHVTNYPSPANLSYAWNLGFLSLCCLALQVSTGILLAMHYLPSTEHAFCAVEHLLRDVNYGWLLRYAHANGASLFFAVVYLHMYRGLYYASYARPRHIVWSLGIALFLLMMATAFIGYVLPWGQMSLWGATVITNLASAIPFAGPTIVSWLWGGYSVSGATLVRFYSLHYLLPFSLAAVSLLHVMALHSTPTGSSNPLSISSAADSVRLSPYFLVKDCIGLGLLALALLLLSAYASEALGHSDNSIEADPLVTPLHIVPEWYFLPYYAILRSVPHKLLGVVAMLGAIVLQGLIPLLHSKQTRSLRALPSSGVQVTLLLCVTVSLGWVGALPVDPPYVGLGQLASCCYYLYFLCLLPVLDSIESIVLSSSVGRTPV